MNGTSSPYEAQTLFKELSAAAELIHARNEQLARRIEDSARVLNQNTQKLTDSGEHLAQDTLNTLRAQGAQVLSQGAGDALNELQQQLKESVNLVRQLQLALVEHRHGVAGLIHTALIVLVIGAVLAMGGSIYVAYDRSRVIENAQFGQDVLQATNSGAINRCGDKLCVRVGKMPARYSQNPNYVLIEGK
jgi:exonuclease VII large subunit